MMLANLFVPIEATILRNKIVPADALDEVRCGGMEVNTKHWLKKED